MRADKWERSVALLLGFALLVWFVYLIRGGLTSWFDNDDLMNIHIYWSRPWAALIKANLEFWSSYYRPGGGLFYRSLYDIWGFHPLPFRIGALIFLAIDFVLLGVVVRQLTESYWAALVALLLVGINPSFGFLYFNTGTVYDILSYAFCWGSFALYLHLRREGRVPGWGGLAAVLVLFVAALNAKEIAVSLPVAVGLYEFLWHPPAGWQAPELWRWVRQEGRFTALGGLLDVVYVIGKRYGPDSLWQVSAYQPHYSWPTYLQSLATYLGQLVYNVSRHGYKPVIITPWQVAWLLAAMLAFAAITRRRCLLWATGFICVSILPLAFIPSRGGSAYFVPSVGWAVYAAGLLDWLIERVSAKSFPLQKAVQAAVLTAMVFILNPWHRQIRFFTKPTHENQARYHRYIDQIRELIPAPRKGSRILLLSDAEGRDDYDVFFVMRLYYGDPKLEVERMRVWNDRHVHVEPASYDYVLDWVDNHFVLVSHKAAS